MLYLKGIFNVQSSSVWLKILSLVAGIVRHRFINSFPIFKTRSLVNGRLISPQFCFNFATHSTRPCASRSGNANVLSATIFKLSHMRRKLPALQPNNIVCVCCKTVRLLPVSYGWAKPGFTQQNKSQVLYIFCDHCVVNSTEGPIQKKKSHSWTFFHRPRKRAVSGRKKN